MSWGTTWRYTGAMADQPSDEQRKNEGGSEGLGWACASAIVIILVAGALVGVRDTLGTTNIALILVALVVAAAAFGGRVAGVTAALVAAISFNFFHTRPYLTLRVTDREDIITVALLLILGLAVGELALLRQRTRREGVAQAAGAHRLEDVVAMLASDAAVDDTWTAVRDGIVRGARACARPASSLAPVRPTCRCSPGPVGSSRPCRTGPRTASSSPRRASIPVVAGNGVLGHIAIEATPGRGVSLDERRIAVALADLLAVAIERSPERIGLIS